MPFKAVQLPMDLWEELNRLRVDPKNYNNDNERRGIPNIIRKLLRDSQELSRIEQSAMSLGDKSIETETSPKSPITRNKHASKKSSQTLVKS